MLIEDEWLSSKLKIPCFNFLGQTFEEYLSDGVQNQIPESFFITLKLSVSPSPLQLSLRSSIKGILQMNQYSWTPRTQLPQINDRSIRFFKIDDLEDIMSIASNSFTLSRFHRDSRLGPKLGESIKFDWLRNNLISRSNCLNIVFEDEQLGFVVGFVSLLSLHESLVIDLFAVDHRFRSRGIGSRLLSKCQSLAVNSGLSLLVGTQSDNPANSIYMNLDFCLTRQYFVFHDKSL